MGAYDEIADIDPVIHAPARLVIMAVLCSAEAADFLFLLRETGLTKGNLSSHLTKLENAGYVKIEKEFVGRKPRTLCRASDEGRKAFSSYRSSMGALLERMGE